ncbi:ferric reductase like transmembrane component-domain-containing protein [Penicillium malachiteum]|nr:ferric reductase like transmembrane component-domain-containing protein [Penicillium malachiteum]
MDAWPTLLASNAPFILTPESPIHNRESARSGPKCPKLDSQGAVLHDMQFYIKAYSGLTRDLFASVVSDDDRSISIHIDEPYGGLVADVTSQYTSLLFVCGGGGISACMPYILHAADTDRRGFGMVEYVHLIWMVRSIDHTTWISEKLEEISGSVKPGFLRVDFYITGDPQSFNGTPGVYNSICSIVGKRATPCAERINIETNMEEEPEPAMRIMHYGRPYLPGMLPSLLQSRRTFIFGCGPEGLLLDLGDATAAAQTNLLRGDADDISLHTESFGCGAPIPGWPEAKFS